MVLGGLSWVLIPQQLGGGTAAWLLLMLDPLGQGPCIKTRTSEQRALSCLDGWLQGSKVRLVLGAWNKLEPTAASWSEQQLLG